jgi:hypothetical protein
VDQRQSASYSVPSEPVVFKHLHLLAQRVLHLELAGLPLAIDRAVWEFLARVNQEVDVAGPHVVANAQSRIVPLPVHAAIQLAVQRPARLVFPTVSPLVSLLPRTAYGARPRPAGTLQCLRLPRDSASRPGDRRTPSRDCQA